MPELGRHHKLLTSSSGSQSDSVSPGTGAAQASVIAYSYDSISVMFATVVIDPSRRPCRESPATATTSASLDSESQQQAQIEESQIQHVILLDMVFSLFDSLLDGDDNVKNQ